MLPRERPTRTPSTATSSSSAVPHCAPPSSRLALPEGSGPDARRKRPAAAPPPGGTRVRLSSRVRRAARSAGSRRCVVSLVATSLPRSALDRRAVFEKELVFVSPRPAGAPTQPLGEGVRLDGPGGNRLMFQWAGVKPNKRIVPILGHSGEEPPAWAAGVLLQARL